jgi:hypothetical protein
MLPLFLDPTSPIFWLFFATLIAIIILSYFYTYFRLLAGRAALRAGRLKQARLHFRSAAALSVNNYRKTLFDASLDGLVQTYQAANTPLDIEPLRNIQSRSQKVHRRDVFRGEGPKPTSFSASKIWAQLPREIRAIIDRSPLLGVTDFASHTLQTPMPPPVEFDTIPPKSPDIVTCGCGQRFRAKPHLFGRQVACPACSQAISIPDPRPENGCVVSCKCGGRFRAKKELCGTQVACPNCSIMLHVPLL